MLSITHSDNRQGRNCHETSDEDSQIIWCSLSIDNVFFVRRTDASAFSFAAGHPHNALKNIIISCAGRFW
jgi:hypothetical protein